MLFVSMGAATGWWVPIMGLAVIPMHLAALFVMGAQIYWARRG
jgi:hypothetical protein